MYIYASSSFVRVQSFGSTIDYFLNSTVNFSIFKTETVYMQIMIINMTIFI